MGSPRSFLPLCAVASLALALSAKSLAADDAPRTVWDGVYSTAQAARGQKAYVAECARCHGKALEGLEDASPLVGPEFLKSWESKNVGRLVDVTRRTMPPETAGTMSRPLTIELVAFLLSSNGFPAGQTDLETNAAALRQISIEPKPGTAPAAP